jgi:hypothetical protein
MQIIWHAEAAKNLSNSHTVLELETFDADGTPITAYCVVPAEQLFAEITQLDANKALHAKFIIALNNRDYGQCQDLSAQLMGKFGGELDSFYEEVLKKYM